MHEQPTLSPAEQMDQEDRVILDMLLIESSHRPWSVDEIARELGRDTTDSLRRLHGAGLIHRLERFVWASHAAVRAEEIAA